MVYANEKVSCGMIYSPSFIEIGIGIHTILRFCLRNMDVGISDGRDLRIMLLRWTQGPSYTYQVPYKDWFRHSKVVRGDTHTDTQTAR
jgi:hypothetical protein